MKSISKEYTDTIAVRLYEITSHDSVRSIEVSVGSAVKDVQTVSGFDWRCPVRITDGDFVDIQNACGVDSVQALELAITQLMTIQAKKAVKKGESLLLFGEVVL